MAAETWTIRLPRTDQTDQPILVHVSRKSDCHTLDLDLLATDNESAYRTKVRNRKIEKLRSTGYEGTAEEWSSILQHILAPSDPCKLSDGLRGTLKVACAVSVKANKSVLNVTIRQFVEGITHKFGVIELTRSEDIDDVDLFSWASQAVQQRDSLAADLRSSNRSSERAEETIKSLREQLQSLIAAKERHETQLLSKFTVLLNEKKLRIRSQQRQLVERDSLPPSKSGSKEAKANKRKTHSSRDTVVDNASESEGFDHMVIDHGQVVDEQDSEDARTASADEESLSERDDRIPLPAQGRCSPLDTAEIAPHQQLPLETYTKIHAGGRPDNEVTSGLDSDDATASGDEEL